MSVVNAHKPWLRRAQTSGPRVGVPDPDADRRSVVRASTDALLVEPEVDAALQLQAQLRGRGLEIDVVHDAWFAVARAALRGAPLAIVSVRLPCEQLHGVVVAMVEELGIPVVLATDTTSAEAIGHAVMAGAQPLLDLPYDSTRVAGTIQVLRARATAPVLHVGRLELLRESLEARVDGASLELGPSEFEMLYLLAQRADRAVARSELTSGRHLGNGGGENATTALVLRIRKKLDSHGATGAVETVRGYGYRLRSAAFD